VIQAGRLTWVMATLSERLPENLPGRYYVDASCIDCDQCRALAPQIFSRNEDQGLSFVSRQPTTSEEIAQVEDILSGCATSSIGNDGA
jgi:ferredoxin